MALDSKAARVLVAIQHDADKSIHEIAKSARLPTHVVQYQMIRLREEGIIRRGVVVNPSCLGLQLYQAFISTNPGLYTYSDLLFNFFRKSAYVNWCAQLGGEYQIGLSLVMKNPSNLAQYFDQIARRFSDPFGQKTLSQVITYYIYPKRYFEYSKNNLHRKPIEVSSDVEISELDEIDRKIIGILPNHDLRGNVEMAKALGLPRSTFEYRLKQLEASKVILRNVYYINSRKLGYSTFIIYIAAKGQRSTALDKLKKFAAEEMSVTFLSYCLGPWDFNLIVELGQAKDLIAVVSRLEANLQDVLAGVQTGSVLEQSTSQAFLSLH